MAGAKFALVLFSLIFASCTEVSDGWGVLLGNAAFQRGEFQASSLTYLRVSPDPATRNVVLYNLGNVDNALGEANTALAVWAGIKGPSSDELRFRLAFNRGHLLYQRGQYEDAYNEFKVALTLKPSNLSAKRNLELSLVKILSFGLGLTPRTSTAVPVPKDTDKAMLDYINRLEGSRWKANNQLDTSQSSSSDW
jgi:tetratricopeptide (TPR) repeat protein